MNLDKIFIGRKLKEYRKKLKLTQEEVSYRIDIDEKHYGKLERGLYMPSLESFFKLINVLNIPLDEFGVLKHSDSKIKNELIKEINIADEKHIQVFYEFFQSVKKLK